MTNSNIAKHKLHSQHGWIALFLMAQSACGLFVYIGLWPNSSFAGQMYRWVDQQGVVHFTDSIPPEAVNLSREIINSEGITTDVVDRAKSPAELQKDREHARLQAEAQRILDAQKIADRVLLRTFRSEDDIVMARNGRLEALLTQIKVAQASIRRYQAKLTDQQYKQAAAIERSAKTVPEILKAEITDTIKRISDTYAIIRQKNIEQQAIIEAFDKDLKRFRILKNLNKGPTVVMKPSNILLDSLIPCGDEGKVCDDAWIRAETFILEHATTPIQIQGDSIIMAKAPTKDSDISITICRIRQKNQPSMLFMDLFCKNSPLGNELCKSPQIDSIRQAYRRQVGGITSP